MNSPTITRRSAFKRFFAAIASVCSLLCALASADAFVIYYTDFETNAGYFNTNSLTSHPDWKKEGSGGNGITNFLPGSNQQAYVGRTPPVAGGSFLSVRHPVNFHAVASNSPVVVFTVLMGLGDSTNAHYDSFYWSAYNADSNYLFTINFNNNDFKIYYALDGTNDTFKHEGWSWALYTLYDLKITMNFASNRWDATLGTSLIVSNKPITTSGLELSLGYIAAEWAITDTNNPGNNYMLFDDYTLSADIIPPYSPQIHILSRQNSYTSLRVTGQSNYQFAIDATIDLAGWTPLTTNVTTAGLFDFVDMGAAGMPQRLYRARWVE